MGPVILVVANPIPRGPRRAIAAPARAPNVVGLTHAELAPALTVPDLTRAALGLVPTVADLTHTELGLVAIAADLTPAATSRVLVDRIHGRVVVDLAVIMPVAALSAADPTFIAMAPTSQVASRLSLATVSMSLRLISRISTLAASSLTLTPRVSMPPRRDLTHISSPRTLTAMSRLLTLKIPTPRLVRRIRVLVGLHFPLGAAAVRAALMVRASASRRFCRARVSRRVARRRIGSAPAASPSTANPPCSARGCRPLINYAWMAA